MHRLGCELAGLCPSPVCFHTAYVILYEYRTGRVLCAGVHVLLTVRTGTLTVFSATVLVPVPSSSATWHFAHTLHTKDAKCKMMMNMRKQDKGGSHVKERRMFSTSTQILL